MTVLNRPVSRLTPGQGLGDGVVWRRWTLFTAAGELIGFAVPALVMAIGPALGVSDAAQVGLAVLVGAVEGSVLGYAQWLALRPSLPRLSRSAWTGATALGAMVAYLLAMLAVALGGAPNLPLWLLSGLMIVLGLGFLLSMGLAQSLVLRRHVPRAGEWIVANALAWSLGVAMPFITLFLVPDGSPVWTFAVAGVLGGVLMGLVVGAVTGLFLVRLLQSA